MSSTKELSLIKPQFTLKNQKSRTDYQKSIHTQFLFSKIKALAEIEIEDDDSSIDYSINSNNHEFSFTSEAISNDFYSNCNEIQQIVDDLQQL